MLIGKDGALTQEQTQKVLTYEQELKRIAGLSDKNLAGEIRSTMRKDSDNLLSQALGIVTLSVFGFSATRDQQWYCQRTAPIRPKYGRTRKKTELKKAAAKAGQ